MKDLDYTPNALAQGLAGSRRGIIAIHFPYHLHGLNITEFEYITAASERALRRGYHLLLWSNSIDDLDGLGSLVNQRLVDGVILMEVLLVDPRIPVLRKNALPFAMIGRPEDTEGVIYVDNDFEALAREAIDYLADLGHRDIVYLAQSDEAIATGHGPFARTERAIGLPAWRRGVNLVRLHADCSLRAGSQALDHLSGLKPRPTAVIGFNEMATSGLLHAAALAGIAIPDDLAVVGLGMAAGAAEMLIPPLTTVSPQSRLIADKAVDALIDVIEGAEDGTPQVLIAPTLTIRDSSAPSASAGQLNPVS